VLAALACSALAASCQLFGLGDIYCEGEENCPSGMSCSDQGLCVDTAGPAVDGGGVSGDLDAGGSDAEVLATCAEPPCSLMPDSATILCRASDSHDLGNCPGEGDPFHGQDGNYSVFPPRFDEPTTEGVVRDLVTGLVWQEHVPVDLVSWNDADSACRDLELGGYAWRLPSQHELVSITDYGLSNRALDLNLSGSDARFWSANGYNSYYWGVHFGSGSYSGYSSSGSHGAVRCVSGAQRPVDSSTFVYRTEGGDPAWYDARTGFTWQAAVQEEERWETALGYCQGLSLANRDDWRLPSMKEIESITDHRADLPHIYDPFQPSAGGLGRFWSSSPCARTYGCWTMDFSTGKNQCDFIATPLDVRCVRGP